jgi:excisionase family DNA binding protein
MPHRDDDAPPETDVTVLRPGDVLTPEEVAEILRVPPKTIVQLCREGRIPRAAKVGRQWRILRSALPLIFTEAAPPPDAKREPTRAQPRPKPSARKVPASKLTRAEILRMLRD